MLEYHTAVKMNEPCALIWVQFKTLVEWKKPAKRTYIWMHRRDENREIQTRRVPPPKLMTSITFREQGGCDGEGYKADFNFLSSVLFNLKEKKLEAK